MRAVIVPCLSAETKVSISFVYFLIGINFSLWRVILRINVAAILLRRNTLEVFS